MYNDLISQDPLLSEQVKLVGIGKSIHLSYLVNWTSASNVAVCADEFPYQAWTDWDAAQRDLYILDSQGNVAYHENITGGFDSNEISDLIIGLLPETSTCDEIETEYYSYNIGSYAECGTDSDCHIENGACGEGLGACYYSVNDFYDSSAIDSLVEEWIDQNCMEGVCDCLGVPSAVCNEGICDTTYCEEANPAGCFQTGCDEGYECIDYFEIDEQNCIPSSCSCDVFIGDWICIEDCNGGICYPIQVSGDVNNDGQINVLDIVLLVGFILGNDNPSEGEYSSSDLNNDGNLNVLDVVSLVGIILDN